MTEHFGEPGERGELAIAEFGCGTGRVMWSACDRLSRHRRSTTDLATIRYRIDDL